METKKLQTAQNLIRLSTSYDNFINNEYFTYKKTTNLLEKSAKKDEYKALIATYSILLLSLFKEEILKKENTNFNSNVQDEILDAIMGNLIQTNGEKYNIGEISFENKLEILETIRNKLLHGDYYIENENIILNNKGITGTISIDDLSRMSMFLIPARKYNKKGPIKNFLITTTKDHMRKNNDIQSLNKLRTFMNGIYVCCLTNLPESENERTPEYVKIVELFFSTLKEKYNQNPNVDIEKIFLATKDIFKDQLKEHKINLFFKKKPVPTLFNYRYIEEWYLNNKHQLNKLSQNDKKNLLFRMTTNILYQDDLNHLTSTSSLTQNLKLLKGYVDNKDNVTETSIISPEYISRYDMKITSLINLFYCTYHYGLDEVLSNQSGTSLKDIINGVYLNFADLDLEKFYDKDMTIDVTFADFPHQLKALEKAKNDEKEKLEKAKNNLKKYYTFATNQSPETENRIMSMVNNYEERYQKALELYEKAEYFMNHDYKKYVKNFNIIAHIRNSIAHGNMKIEPFFYETSITNRIITFEDIYEGENTYSLKVKCGDFLDLFQIDNISIITDFIETKINSKIGNIDMTLKKI